MNEIRFYHLQRQSPERALPALLTKALQSGKHILVQTNSVKSAKQISEALWTYDPDSFLPHVLQDDEFSTNNAVVITHTNDNPNAAKIIINLHGTLPNTPEDFDLCCVLFDGNDAEALTAARAHWKDYKAQDKALTYWQQSDKGWEQKA